MAQIGADPGARNSACFSYRTSFNFLINTHSKCHIVRGFLASNCDASGVWIGIGTRSWIGSSARRKKYSYVRNITVMCNCEIPHSNLSKGKEHTVHLPEELTIPHSKVKIFLSKKSTNTSTAKNEAVDVHLYAIKNPWFCTIKNFGKHPQLGKSYACETDAN